MIDLKLEKVGSIFDFLGMGVIKKDFHTIGNSPIGKFLFIVFVMGFRRICWSFLINDTASQ